MAKIDVKDENLRSLMKIQDIIEHEDGTASNIDEALARVLTFYRIFVPYN